MSNRGTFLWHQIPIEKVLCRLCNSKEVSAVVSYSKGDVGMKVLDRMIWTAAMQALLWSDILRSRAKTQRSNIISLYFF